MEAFFVLSRLSFFTKISLIYNKKEYFCSPFLTGCGNL